MSILKDIKTKENIEYRDMPAMIRRRKAQIKKVQHAREAKGQSDARPKKVILPCIDCGEPMEFFRDEALKLCAECMP